MFMSFPCTFYEVKHINILPDANSNTSLLFPNVRSAYKYGFILVHYSIFIRLNLIKKKNIQQRNIKFENSNVI